MIAAILLLAGAPAPTITYECAATRAETLFAKLSELAGEKLMTSPATKDEFLVLRVKDVPLSELREKIAAATAAEWIREADGYRLIRSAKLLQEQDREHLRSYTAKLAAAQKKLKDQLEKAGPFDGESARSLSIQVDAMIQDARNNRGQPRNWQAQQRLDQSLPGGRLAQRLAARLDPGMLASMEAPGKLVFSTQPNRMQAPLGAEAWEAIRAYVRERDLLKPLINVGEAGGEGLPYSLWSLRNSMGLTDQEPAKVLVQASRWESGSGTSIQVWVANRAGQVLDGANANLQTESFGGPMPTAPEADPSGAKPIELSERSKALADLLKTVMARGGDPQSMPPLPEPIRAVVLQPEEHNLSEFVLSDLLLGTGRAKGLNVVAGVSDLTGLFTVMQFGGGSPSPNQFLERMRAPQHDSEFVESPRWLLMRPLDPYVDRTRKIDRSALGRLIRQANSKGMLTIDECAAFAASTPDGFDRTPVMVLMMLSSPKAMRSMERASFQVLKFHGLLTLGQRQALANGAKLAYAQMTPAQKRIFHRLVFMEQDGLSRTSRSNVPLGAEEFHGETLQYQPTERFPNGIPPGGTVSLTFKEGPILAMSGTFGQYRTSSEMDLTQFAFHLLAKESGNVGNPDQEPNYNEFTYIEERSYHYTFAPDDTLSFGSELKEEGTRSKTVSSPEQLPPDIWAKIKAEMETIRKRQRPPSGGGGGGGR